MRAAGGAVAAIAVLLLAGCAPVAEPSTALPDGVTVHFTQLRSDVAARQGQVTVTNGTEEALTIGTVRVDDPRFDGPAGRVVERQSTLAPGAAVDVRIQLPDAACEALDDGEATVTLMYGIGDTAPESEATAPLPDPLDVLVPLHERECRGQALAAAASVSFSSFTPSPAGEPARLELEIAPTGDADAVIAGIQTTNLLTFGQTPGDAADEYPLDLAVGEGDSRPIVVGLPLVPLRCDPHAVQEDKRGTIFDLSIEVDGEPGEIELAADEDMRGAILSWVADWCGFGG